MEKENIILLLETIERSMSTKPIMITETEISGPMGGSFYIETFNPHNPPEKEFITKNKQRIKDFFDEGYESAGLGSWFGCRDANSVKRNTVLLKVAWQKGTGKILAMSIYSGRNDGYKCVGITAVVTQNQELRNMAKEALVYIIKGDIAHMKDYFWIECSGAIKHYWEKNGGLKIPNSYLPSIFAKSPGVLEHIKLIPDEEYDYLREIGGEYEQKCIFGFPNKEVLDKYIEDTNIKFDEYLAQLNEQHNIDESAAIDIGRIKAELDIFNYFESYIQDESLRTYEVTEHMFKVLQNVITRTEEYVRKYANMLPEAEKRTLVWNVERGYWAANLLSILKPYQFGDEFISEREIYPEDFSYDDHERRYL